MRGSFKLYRHKKQQKMEVLEEEEDILAQMRQAVSKPRASDSVEEKEPEKLWSGNYYVQKRLAFFEILEKADNTLYIRVMFYTSGLKKASNLIISSEIVATAASVSRHPHKNGNCARTCSKD